MLFAAKRWEIYTSRAWYGPVHNKQFIQLVVFTGLRLHGNGNCVDYPGMYECKEVDTGDWETMAKRVVSHPNKTQSHERKPVVNLAGEDIRPRDGV